MKKILFLIGCIVAFQSYSDDVSGYFYFNEYADIYDQYENYGHYLIEDYQETEQDSVDILCD